MAELKENQRWNASGEIVEQGEDGRWTKVVGVVAGEDEKPHDDDKEVAPADAGTNDPAPEGETVVSEGAAPPRRAPFGR